MGFQKLELFSVRRRRNSNRNPITEVYWGHGGPLETIFAEGADTNSVAAQEPINPWVALSDSDADTVWGRADAMAKAVVVRALVLMAEQIGVSTLDLATAGLE